MHGGDIYRQQVTYDFSVNINPIGLPDAVRQVMENSGDLAMQYPDLQCQKLRIKLADCLGIRPEQILCGNGASELILAVCHMLRPKKALLSAPCFSGYETALQAVGTEVIRVPLSEADGFAFTEEYGRKLETRIKEEKPELLFLTTPNNPTGKLTEPAYIRRLLTVCEKTCTYLVLDECFMELTGQAAQYSMLRDAGHQIGISGRKAGSFKQRTKAVTGMERLNTCTGCRSGSTCGYEVSGEGMQADRVGTRTYGPGT